MSAITEGRVGYSPQRPLAGLTARLLVASTFVEEIQVEIKVGVRVDGQSGSRMLTLISVILG